MNKLLRAGILTAFAGAATFGGVAQADEATTSGGFKIKTDDGKFDASIGGRIHFDGALNLPASHPFGASAAGSDAASTFEFRRVFLTFAGHLYGFEYKFEDDLTSNSFQDVYIAHPLVGGVLYAGQHKPWRSLDELASNNNVPFMERNYASASNGGIYGDRDFSQGLFYRIALPIGLVGGDSLWAGASVYSLKKQASGAQTRTQGTGYNARIAYAPFTDKDKWLHVGASFSNDNLDSGSYSGSLASSFKYAGRYGSAFKLAEYKLVAAPVAAGNPHVDTIHGELAGTYGPLYLQAEFVDASFHQTGVYADGVDAYSVTTAYSLTGESRSYDKNNATYTGIKPRGPNGALELAVRYDHARNTSAAGYFIGADKAATASQLSVSTITVGLNYYVNPAVRLMLDYQHGRATAGTAGQDSPNAIGLRAQLVF